MSRDKSGIPGGQAEGTASGKWTRLLGLICGVLFAVDLLVEKHGHHAWENLPGAYGLFALIACFLLVVIASLLRRAVARDEDYYD